MHKTNLTLLLPLRRITVPLCSKQGEKNSFTSDSQGVGVMSKLMHRKNKQNGKKAMQCFKIMFNMQ